MLEAMTNQMDAYLRGVSHRDDLHLWIASHLEEILRSKNEKVIAFENALSADFSELSEGLIDEQEFYSRVSGYLRDAETIAVLLNQELPRERFQVGCTDETIKGNVEDLEYMQDVELTVEVS